jgi:glutaredoxin
LGLDAPTGTPHSQVVEAPRGVVKEVDMRTNLFVIMLAMLIGTQCLCFGETRRPLGQKVVVAEKPTAMVEIYIADWCPYCAQAIKFLKANNIQYVAYNIEKDSRAAERKKELSGRKGVPFAIINGKKIYGFSEETYSRALGLKSRSGQP